MKNTTVITRIGLSNFAKILVSCCFLAACHGYENSDPMADALSDYICQDKCDRVYFKPFKDQMVHIEIEPAGEMSQIFYNVEPENLSSSPIILREPVNVSGTVVGDKSLVVAERTRRDKSAVFSDIIALPLANDRFFSPRTPTVKTSLSMDARFSMTVLSGIPYSLVLNPQGARNRAPFYVNVGVLNDEKSLEFDLNDKQINISGRIIAKDRLIPSNDSEKLQAKVMQGNRLVSSVGTVASDGKFSLEVSNPLFEAQMPINLIIVPANSEMGLPKIKIKLKPEDLRADLDLKDIDIGSIEKPISAIIEVRGDGALVPKSYVFLKAKIGVGESLLKKPMDLGSMDLKVYPGTYDIAVVPPADSPFALQLLKSIDLKDKEKIVVTLSKRQVLNAQVLAPTGIPVNKAQIEFFRIGEMDNFATEDIYDDMLFKLIASTDDQGHIGKSSALGKNEPGLLLDEGRYLAHIIPPAGSKLAHKWLTIDFPKEQNLVIDLGKPQVLAGQVVAFDGHTPIKRAFVTVYLAQNLHSQPKVMANAMTDEMGFFKAFVSEH